MDFGFGSLVDKFEDQVGPRPTRVLLWLSAVALFVICSKTIVTEGVIPVVDLVRGISSRSALNVIQTVGIGAVATIAAGLLFTVVVRALVARIVKRAQRIITRAETMVAESKRRSDEEIARAEAVVEAAELVIEEAKRINTELVEKAKRQVASLAPEASPSPSPLPDSPPVS